MKKFRSFALILALCMMLSVFAPVFGEKDEEKNTEQTEQAEEVKQDDGTPDITAHSVMLVNPETDKVLFSKNATEKAYPASLTKVMTVLLAVEAVEQGKVAMTDKIEAFSDCRHDLDDDSSSADIMPGEMLTFEDLMYCAMVESANEACNIIGEFLAGSISAFVEQMNAKAKEIGCTGTHFMNPHGLPDENHYTTAQDMYKICKEALNHDLFVTICNAQSYTVPATNVSKERVIYNSNALISGKGVYGSGYIYDYATGIKTGHTNAAGYCLASSALKNGVHLVCIVMGSSVSPKGDGSSSFGNFTDSIALYNWAFSNFQYRTVFTSQSLVSEVAIKYAPDDQNTVNLHPEEDISLLVSNSVKDSEFETVISLYEDEPEAPIKAGEALGDMQIILNGEVLCTTRLLASTDVEKSQASVFNEKLHNIFGQVWVKIVIWLIVLVVIIYVVLVVRYSILRQKHRKEKRRAELERQRIREEEAANEIFRTPPKMEYFTQQEMNAKPRPIKAEKPVYDVTSDPSQKAYFNDFFKKEEIEMKESKKNNKSRKTTGRPNKRR